MVELSLKKQSVHSMLSVEVMRDRKLTQTGLAVVNQWTPVDVEMVRSVSIRMFLSPVHLRVFCCISLFQRSRTEQ